MFNQSKSHGGTDEQPAMSAGEIAEPYRLLLGEDDDLGGDGEFYEDDDDGEGPFESLLKHVADIEAGLVPGWKLDRRARGTRLEREPFRPPPLACGGRRRGPGAAAAREQPARAL